MICPGRLIKVVPLRDCLPARRITLNFKRIVGPSREPLWEGRPWAATSGATPPTLITRHHLTPSHSRRSDHCTVRESKHCAPLACVWRSRTCPRVTHRTPNRRLDREARASEQRYPAQPCNNLGKTIDGETEYGFERVIRVRVSSLATFTLCDCRTREYVRCCS